MLKNFAEDLKAIREEKKISLKDISHQTRLSVTALENLENGDYTFQPQTYIRAFLKQYINCLGLDVEETLFEYDLARSGKYKTKKQPALIDHSRKEEVIESKDPKSKITDKLKEIVETPKKNNEETESAKTIDSIHETSKEKKSEIFTLKKDNEKKAPYLRESSGKKIFSFLNSPISRNIVLFLFIACILLGIYSLINILFFEGKFGDNPEIIRQNFDEVVKEQERKILGKRTPEEIQDSIRKAEEQLASAKDSITLRINSISSGTIFLVRDSINYNKPEKIVYSKNEVGVFKAKNSFYISSGNTESFKATINDKPLKFESISISKIKITKEGISR